jgi:hypothetical protein
VSSHILHEIEAMTSNILIHNDGSADGNVHQIRALIDEHRTRCGSVADPRRSPPAADGGRREQPSLRARRVVVQTLRPDAFYSRLTERLRQA